MHVCDILHGVIGYKTVDFPVTGEHLRCNECDQSVFLNKRLFSLTHSFISLTLIGQYSLAAYSVTRKKMIMDAPILRLLNKKRFDARRVLSGFKT